MKRKNFIDGVDAARAAPDADDEVHRHEHDLPEHVEEGEVEGDEAAEHARLEDQEGDREAAHLLLDVRVSEKSSETGVRTVVSRTSSSEMPSMPT